MILIFYKNLTINLSHLAASFVTRGPVIHREKDCSESFDSHIELPFLLYNSQVYLLYYFYYR